AGGRRRHLAGDPALDPHPAGSARRAAARRRRAPPAARARARGLRPRGMSPLALAVFFLGLGLILGAALVVAAPLFQAAPEGAALPPAEREALERRKRQALAAIREAELDHRMGKLSDDDLQTMRARFEAQALEAMAALEKEGR